MSKPLTHATRIVATACCETAIVCLALLLGKALASQFVLIPEWIINLPDVTLEMADWIAILSYFGVIGLGVFGLSNLLFGDGVLTSARRAAKEIYALVLVFTLAPMSLFLSTSINFDPEFFLAASITAFLAFVLVFAALRRTGDGFLRAAAALVGQAASLLVTLKPFPFALLIALLAMSPIVVAKMFATDRSFAAAVTTFRVALNTSGDYAYSTVDAFPGLTFRQPTTIGFSSADPDDVYVLERHGRVYRFDPKAAPASKELVLDFADRLNYVEIELGALGMGLHPDFGDPSAPSGGHVFIYYTHFVENERQLNRLSRFDLSLPDQEARQTSETVLFELEAAPYGFHNGGGVAFGPDGFLYVAVGEASVKESHQTINHSLFGGVVRIDVDRQGGAVSHPPRRQPADGTSAHYFIPSDNPFVWIENAMEEYWALGFRNPFRIAFDPGTGDLWAGDVGGTSWEEINRVRKGGNHQFPYREGGAPTSFAKPETIVGEETPPVYAYSHTAYERAVIGGTVYRGDRFADLDGTYLFADNYSGHVYAFPIDPIDPQSVRKLARASQVAQRGITSIVSAPNGGLFLTTLGDINGETGKILELLPIDEAPQEADQEETAIADASAPIDAKGLFVTYCARCHGLSGDGVKSDMAEFDVTMPDFTSAAYHKSRSDDEIKLILVNGGDGDEVNELMPPWDNILNPAEIDAVTAYLRALPARYKN